MCSSDLDATFFLQHAQDVPVDLVEFSGTYSHGKSVDCMFVSDFTWVMEEIWKIKWVDRSYTARLTSLHL